MRRRASRGNARAAALVGLLLLPVLWLMPAATSIAGEYHVYSCRVPYGSDAGAPAPVEVAAELRKAQPGRWSLLATGSGLYGNECATGGSLAAALQAGPAHSDGDLTTWQFTAPTDESIVKATLWRAGDADGGEGYLFWLASPTNPAAHEVGVSADAFGICANSGGCPHSGLGNTNVPLATANEVPVPAKDLPSEHLYINASCSQPTCPEGSGDAQGYATVVYVYATDIVLEEHASPTVSDVKGSLASDSTLSGTEGLSFDAEDDGSGVYQLTLSVDGNVQERRVIDPDGGRCEPVDSSPDSDPAFLYAVPCPQSVEATISLDTTKLANGSHTLLVSVTNAAGNATKVLERTVEAQNGPRSGQGTAGGTSLQTGELPKDALAGSTPTSEVVGAPNGRDASDDVRLRAAWATPTRKGRRTRANSSRTAVSRRHRAMSNATTTLTVPFGHSQARIAGRLTTIGGTPIVGAKIDASARARYGGARAMRMRAVSTSGGGYFELTVGPRISSRTIKLSYASRIGGPPVAQRTLKLDVKAGLRLKVRPRTVSAGETIVLSGKVLGRPIPPSGKQVVLEAKAKGTPWLQFLVLHTNDAGAFRGKHRFRLAGPMRYSFRASSPREADFPFLAGRSDTVTVLER